MSYDLGSETTQVLCLCVYGLCESQRGKVSETEQAVFRECIGTNATERWHIKVGICFFFPEQRSCSLLPLCDLLSL